MSRTRIQRFPVDEKSYEAYDPEKQSAIEGLFVAGWSREASSGLVGIARKDGENGARAMLEYLETIEPHFSSDQLFARLKMALSGCGKRVISKQDVIKLERIEQAQAQSMGLEEYKFVSNEEMLAAIEKS